VTDGDCPDDGACLALEGDAEERLLCWSRCDVSGDCYAGTRCTQVEGAPDVDRICLP